MDRDAFLDRLAARSGRPRGAPLPPVPRLGSQVARAEQDGDLLMRRFVERLRDVGGDASVVADRAEAQAAVARLLAERQPGSLACPPALRWPEVEAMCSADSANAVFGLSEPRWAVAETGTVVLWNDGESPRAISLLPSAVGFLLPASRIVARLDDVLREISDVEQDVPACITFVTGPSRSMDIGYVSCVGVHGPGQTTVWILADE